MSTSDYDITSTRTHYRAELPDDKTARELYRNIQRPDILNVPVDRYGNVVRVGNRVSFGKSPESPNILQRYVNAVRDILGLRREWDQETVEKVVEENLS